MDKNMNIKNGNYKIIEQQRDEWVSQLKRQTKELTEIITNGEKELKRIEELIKQTKEFEKPKEESERMEQYEKLGEKERK